MEQMQRYMCGLLTKPDIQCVYSTVNTRIRSAVTGSVFMRRFRLFSEEWTSEEYTVL